MRNSHYRFEFAPGTEEMLIKIMKGSSYEYTNTWDQVKNVDLSSNKFVGEIPVELTTLSELVGLKLANNHLSGDIPNNIRNMIMLISLDLSGNELGGLIPPSITNLNFLSHLNLSNNKLLGRIPTGNQLQALIDPSIYAGNKDLCGFPLPKNCSNPDDPTITPNKKYEAAHEPNKVWFYVDIICGYATGFWGVIVVLMLKKQWRHKVFMFAEESMDKIHVAIMIPNGVANVDDDEDYYEPALYLQNNTFNELIPRSLCKRTNLVNLDLSNNRLTGEIPKCFKNLQNLRFLRLSSNGLSGIIPSFIGNISELSSLNLNHNNFSGEFPAELWNLSRLWVLGLGDNALCGKLPEWIGEKIKSLLVFRLHKNNFTGEFLDLCAQL
ncbi:putative non-specific serine/threonine protein kinase [Helianthus anomalus]